MCLISISSLGKGSEKKNRISYGLLPNRGGGSAREVKKPYCFFEKVFFQRACRIILGPPKHVLHLVWSVLGISTAIKTASFVAFDTKPSDPLIDHSKGREDHQSSHKVSHSELF